MSAASNTNLRGDFEAYCPDPFCYERLFFEGKVESVRCFYCGQTFLIDQLMNIQQIEEGEADNLYRRIKTIPPRSGAEWARVNGLSSFYCKVVSHLFTEIGRTVDQSSNSRNDRFDCRELYDCAFAIEEADLMTYGYGADIGKSQTYLSETLSKITEQNDSIDVLAILRVPGDGSCLVHALSRALVGREVYWHPLRECLRQNLVDNESKYKEVMGGFVADDDWVEMIKECDASYAPLDDRFGLRNAHIFVLANVLCRPIVLLDNPKNMAMEAEFSAVFLPALRKVKECKNESGVLHRPLIVGWANEAHDHFVPLVKIDGRPLPKLARSFLPKAWCVNDEQTEQYISFTGGFCNVACGRIITKSYSRRIFDYIDAKFTRAYGLSAQLLCDYCEIGNSTFSQKTVQETIGVCLNMAHHGLLYRCLVCWRLISLPLPTDDIFGPKSKVFSDLMKNFENWDTGCICETPRGSFRFDKEHNRFHLVHLYECMHCHAGNKPLRLQLADGTILFQDGDHTRIPAPEANCKRKMKHSLRGNLYDQLPVWFTKDRRISCIDPLWRLSESDNEEIVDETLIHVDAKRDSPNNKNENVKGVVVVPSPSSVCQKPKIDLNLPVTFENGRTGFIRCKVNVTEEELRKTIYNTFIVRPEQIDKIAYITDQDCLDTFPSKISTCSGIIIYSRQDEASKMCSNVYGQSERIKSLVDLKNAFDARIGTNHFWKLLQKQPGLFKANGVIYNLLLNEKGLKDSYHYVFSAIPNVTFVYCGKLNAVRVCVSKVGHFEANERLQKEIRNQRSPVKETYVAKALNDLNKAIQKCFLPFTTVFCFEKFPGCIYNR